MKNSKGFTMIELIAVFLIVAALSVIGVVTVNAIMAKVEENYYADIEQELLLAGSEYYSDNQRDRPVDSYNKVELSTLVDNKYIEKILDKNGADTCTGNVYIFKNAAKYDYQACLSCGKRSDGTYVYSSTGSYCQNLVKDIVYVDARTDGGSTYSGTLSYENTDWTSANYVNFTFSMNSGTVSKYVITNLSTLESNDCIATNNVCTKKINATGSYSVTAYGVEGNILGSAKYFNAKFDRTAPTFDVTLSSGKFRYGFDEHSYHFSSKIINLKDDNGIKSVTYTLTGTKVIAQNEDITNTLSIDKDLPSGRYTLTVKVVDVAGNTKTFTGSGNIEVIMPIKIIYTDIEGTVFDKGFKEVVNGLAYSYSGNFTYGYNTKFPEVESYFYLDNAKKNRIYSTTLVNSPDPYTIYAFDSYILQAPPTASEYCSNPVYNGNLQVITKAADVGFTFSNNKKTDYSSSGYDVVATLGDLYMWTTLNRNDVKINCNITPKPVTVTMVPKTFIYDGTDKYSDDCTADSLIAGHSVTCVHNITSHGTGTATANPKTITIKDSGGVNVTKNYKITKGESTLTVNPRPITITSPSISCTYGACKDTTIASNLKNNTTASNLVDGWTFTIGASNSTVASRLDKNAGTYNTGADVGSTFTIKDASGQDITNRCTITYKAGVLTVNKAEPSISFGVSAGDEIVGTSSIPITVTSEVAGSISVTTSNSDVSVSGTGSITAGGSRTLTVTGKNTYGSTTLSITLTSSNSNYKNITKTVTVNTFKLADKGNCAPNLVYNGETQYLGENGTGVMFVNNGRKNVGTTTVTVSALTGFKFSDGTTSKTLSCSVSKRSITVTSNNLSCTYGSCNNLGHSYKNTVSNLPSMFSVIQSPQMPDFNTYDVGTYEKVLAPGDFKVYITSGMTDVTSNFTINHAKGTLTINPAPISKYNADQLCNTGLVYNGNSQTLAKKLSDNVTLTNNTRTNAGSQNVTVALNSTKNFKWTDGTTSSYTISCSIAKATPSLTLSKTSVSLIGTAQSCFSATTDLLQSSVSSSSSNASIAGATGSGSMSTGTKNICAVGKDAFGTATITVSLTPNDTTNYNSVSKTASVSTKILVTMPSCNTLTYNGTTQALVPASANLMLTSGSGMGPSGKDAGTYTVVGSPVNGYAFSDGAANKSVKCTIAKADPTLSFTSSGIIIGNRSVTLYAKPNIAGSLSVSSSNASITASGSGSVAANGQKGFPVSANNVSGSSTITVNFTPTDTKNYNTKSATATVTAYKEANPGSCVANLRYTGSNQTVVSGGVGVTYTTKSFSSVGLHQVTAAASNGYLFSDNTGSKLLECTIGKALASTGSCQSLTYTGSSQTLMLHGVGVTYSNNSRTAAGSQDVTINAITNYEFSDGTTSKKVSCSISKATATTGTCADLTYNGGSRVLMSGGTGVTYSNNSRTAAGTQTVTINADSNHVFSDGTSSKTKDCTIKPAAASYGSCNSLSYNGSAQTLASGASNATYSNNSRTAAGSQNVTVTANTNYAFSDGSTTKTLSCSIARAQTANPGTCKSGLIYNGSAQTLMSGGTSVTYSNNSRTAAGSQTVTVNADSNHAFVGGSTSTTVSCSIGKKAATITAPSCTIEYDGASHTCGGASSCTVTGLVGSDSPSLSCGTTTKTAMGSYTVTAGGSISDNYSITYSNGTMTIRDTTSPLCSIVAASGTSSSSLTVAINCSDNSNNYTCGFDSYTGPTTKTLTDTKTVTGYIKDSSGNTNSCSKKFTRTSTTQTRYRSCAVSKCALYGGYSSSTSYVTSCSADGTKGAGSSYTTCSSQTIYRTYCTPKCVLNGNSSVTTKTGTTQYGSWQGSSPSKTTCSMTCSSGSSYTYTNGIESKSGYKKNSYSGGSCTSYSCSTWGTYGSWSTKSCTSANPASTSSGLKDCQTQTVYSWS